ncbi:MAG TPA: hypothetical protein VHZ02_08190 [Acidimicrobiales bacterium]|jgi:hypothetical protein|nr:hypothetical protein [Acidimicrobiales bacterium]
MNNPLEVGGVDDYPVKVGSMLMTLVDPSPGYEQAYNRWYERDHFYAGCMIGPWLFAGSRWVATRELKDRRWPKEGGTVAAPYDAGSFIAIYWVEQGHHDDHFEAWAVPQVRDLYANGRGFAERRHVHTSLFDHIGSLYRDEDPVPIELALDRGYRGLVVLWWDGPEGTEGSDLHQAVATGQARTLLAGSDIEIASSWTPSAPDEGPRDVPMDLGSPGGGPNRLVQLLFVNGDVQDALDPIRAYTSAVEAAGLGRLQLAAPFHSTVVGTDTYVDQLW